MSDKNNANVQSDARPLPRANTHPDYATYRCKENWGEFCEHLIVSVLGAVMFFLLLLNVMWGSNMVNLGKHVPNEIVRVIPVFAVVMVGAGLLFRGPVICGVGIFGLLLFIVLFIF